MIYCATLDFSISPRRFSDFSIKVSPFELVSFLLSTMMAMCSLGDLHKLFLPLPGD
jgi:hypothetical protein